MNFQILGLVLILAWLVEGIVELVVKTALNAIWTEPTEQQLGVATALKLVTSIALGIVLAFATGIDLLNVVAKTFGQTIEPTIGLIFTGVILGRGSNFIHDFWKRIQNPMSILTKEIVESEINWKDAVPDVSKAEIENWEPRYHDDVKPT